tara:strand:+ start:1311 stop:1781 length:471 start_codon:yes stop_codon:yes gene_type:complete
MNNIDSNNNIWGPPAWKFLHTITFNYPNNPSINDKITYKNFFIILQNIIPCSICQYNYKLHMEKFPIDKYLNSRDNLVKWLINIHNEVNKLHNKPIKNYDEIINYYTQLYNNNPNSSNPNSSNPNLNHNLNPNNNSIIILCIIFIIILFIIYKKYL